MCKRCSSYIDLLDYDISSAVSKNFKTKGTFVVQPKGYVFNTEARVGDAVIKGRFLGKLVAERTLTLHSTAEIRGTFTAACLVVPVGNSFHWNTPIKVGAADIAGELVANLHAETAIHIQRTGRVFGDVESTSLVVEEGGVLVGVARVGPRLLTEQAAAATPRASETAVKPSKKAQKPPGAKLAAAPNPNPPPGRRASGVGRDER
jgi:cytoskeletal protein CcmA (bactofilin family)